MRSAKEVEAEQAAGDERFEIGSDSDDEEEDEGRNTSEKRTQDPPPPYAAEEQDDIPNRDGRHTVQPVADQGDEAETENNEDTNDAPPRTHVVCKGETVRSLSLKYNLDVSRTLK
jgi:hypothetical protein